MKKGNLQLDLSNVSTMSSRVVLPTGNYPVKVVSSEIVETTKGGYMIKAGLEVLSGDHKGSVVFNTFNIQNDSEDAVRIGLQQLKTLLVAGQFKNPDLLKDTSDMIGLELVVYVEEEDHKFTNKEGEEIETTQNRFKGYMKLEDAQESEEEEVAAPKKATKKSPAKTKKQEVEPEEEEEEESSSSFPWQK